MPSAFVNGYEPVQFSDFSGGANLRDKADAVGDKEALDLLNVSFTDRGAIKQRYGTSLFNQAALLNRPDSMSSYYSVSGKRYLVLGAGNRLDVLDHLGALISSQAGLAHGPYNFARFGDPDKEWLFAANGVDTIQRYDGTSWDNGTTSATVNKAAGSMPRAGAVCVAGPAPGLTSQSNANNRLYATAFGTQVNAGPGGQPTNPSRLYFSNQGAPMVWETDGVLEPASGSTEPYLRGINRVDFTPGDGEAITAAVSWRELVFVFKQTKFFVVWGESQNADSTPRLQYREVVNQAGLASPQAIAVGRDGVYFMNRRGVYITNGGEPQLLSDIISPLWSQDPPDVYYSGRPINLDQLALVRAGWDMERFYLAVPTGFSSFNNRLLVYDTQHKWWTVYDLAVSAMAGHRPVSVPSLYFALATGEQSVGYIDQLRNDDKEELARAPVAIESFWRSGFGDYGSSVQKTIRETKVWGQGEVITSFSIDFNKTQRGKVLTRFGVHAKWPTKTVGKTWNDWILTNNGLWPQAGTIANALVRYARRGTLFSTQFTNSPTAPTWSVHRVASHLRETREPSIR